MPSLSFRLPLVFVLLLLPLYQAQAGWSFDTAVSAEAARDLFAAPGSPRAPADSWLRLRDLVGSRVRTATGEEDPWPTARAETSVIERRAALAALKERGYHLVALVRWSSDTWAGGVRPGQPLRRLPLDLREAADRCRRLSETYGDLVDYWEIDNEPDISFVEENPETYAAFQKACFLGFRQGADAFPQSSRVLAAAFALPPGPYFAAWMANDGLRYLDGFNYHFYGYAEDFTGVYRQFEAAVTRPVLPAPANEAVFSTQFYPASAGWRPRILSRFAADAGEASAHRAALQSRPLATHEPTLEPQGRWLVTPGTVVREADTGWEFTVHSPAADPMRPAMAELPLPAGWKTGADTSLAFEYRVEAVSSGISAPAAKSAPAPTRPRHRFSYPPLRAVKSGSTPAMTRQLPVFLTEYGYGLLDDDARRTSAGREAQRAWFESTGAQARSLGIAQALAFNLQPNYSVELGEFGLLMNPESSPSGEFRSTVLPGFRGFSASPALADLLQAGKRRIKPKSWRIAVSPPLPIVIDFVAGDGVRLDKTRCAYVLPDAATDRTTGSPQRIVLYNFGTTPVRGELRLDGAWTLAGGAPARTLSLNPGERREVEAVIHLAPGDSRGPQRAAARFIREEEGSPVAPAARAMTISRPAIPSAVSPQPEPEGTPLPPPLTAGFEAYLRTQNGNLYQSWPRLTAREEWQWYVEPFVSFTPAFFARAHLPAALDRNEPVSLAFFFRPDRYPVTYRIRRAAVVRFETPAPAGAAGKK